MSITIKQLDNSSVTPKDDAVMYAMMLSGDYGKIYGLAVTSLGSNQIHVAAGRLIVKGREIVIDEETINVLLSTSGTKKGQLYLHIDLSNTTTPAAWVSEAVDTLTTLTQDEEFNYSNGIWDVQFCTYSVSETAVSALTVTLQELSPVKTELANINSNLINERLLDYSNRTMQAITTNSQFNAPSDGILFVSFTSTVVGAWVTLNVNADASLSDYLFSGSIAGVNYSTSFIVPLSKGDFVKVANLNSEHSVFVPYKYNN